MQNRYVGDVGDFGKYGLLRALCQPESVEEPALRLGVVWYLTSDETHNNDGRHIGYLEPTPRNVRTFRHCDPELYDLLGDIVRNDSRRVSAIPQWGVLPKDTVYYDRLLDFGAEQVRANPATRVQARQEWVQDALQVTKDCDVVFVDPDNGIGASTQAHSRRGGKYVLLEELAPYIDRGQTLVVYHHLNRQVVGDLQIKNLISQLRTKVGLTRRLIVLRYRRGSARVFILCLPSICEDILEARTQTFLRRSWNQHFERYLSSAQG